MSYSPFHESLLRGLVNANHHNSPNHNNNNTPNPRYKGNNYDPDYNNKHPNKKPQRKIQTFEEYIKQQQQQGQLAWRENKPSEDKYNPRRRSSRHQLVDHYDDPILEQVRQQQQQQHRNQYQQGHHHSQHNSHPHHGKGHHKHQHQHQNQQKQSSPVLAAPILSFSPSQHLHRSQAPSPSDPPSPRTLFSHPTAVRHLEDFGMEVCSAVTQDGDGDVDMCDCTIPGSLDCVSPDRHLIVVRGIASRYANSNLNRSPSYSPKYNNQVSPAQSGAPTDDAIDLLSFLVARLGNDFGDWRDDFLNMFPNSQLRSMIDTIVIENPIIQ